MARLNRGRIPSELGFLVDLLDDIERRLRTLEAPDGQQFARVIAELQQLVTNLEARMTDFIENDVQTLIAAEVASQIATALAGSVSIGGSLTVAGTVTLPGARATGLSSAPDRVTAWIAGDGRLGHTAA